MNAPVPPEEAQRLQELKRYAILDTPPEAAFERLTRMAARLFNVPIALVNLIDTDRQWFKSCYGLNIRETSRDIALCAYTILSDEILVVQDTTQDPRFADNPLVTGAEGIRFYAGAPLHTPHGINVGTLAVIDVVQRHFNEAELATLADLAALAVDAMELRLTAGELHKEVSDGRRQASLMLQRSEEHFRALIENASDIITVVEGEGTIRYHSPSLKTVLGYETGELIGKNALGLMHPEDVGFVEDALTRIMQEPGVTQAVEYRFRHRDGSWRVLESIGKTMLPDSVAGGIVVNSRDVTERKQALESLQWAKNQLQAVLDTIPGGVTWVSSDGRYLGVNRYLTERFKIPTETFIGQPIGFMNISPGYEKWVRGFLNGAQEQDSFEFSVDINGSPHTILMMARRYDGDRAAVLVGIDISERKAAEAALQKAHDELEERVRERTAELDDVVEALRDEVVERRRAQDELDRFFRVSIDMLCIAGVDGYFKRLNPAFQKTLGYSDAEFLAQPIFEFLHPDDQARTIAQFERLAAGGLAVGFQDRYLRKDGAVRWIEWMAAPVVNEGLIYAVGHDITKRKQAEAELQEQKALLQTMFDHIPVMISIYDSLGQKRLVNREWQQIMGWSLDDAQNHPDLLAAAYPDPQGHQQVVQHMQEASGEWADFKTRVRDGRILDTSWSNIRLPGGLSVGIGQDITERKQGEERLRLAKEKAERANLAKTQLLSRVSHELRTPLQAILGFAQLMEMDELNDEHRQGVEQILKGGQQLLELVNQVLDIMHIEPEQMLLEIESVPIVEALAASLDQIRLLAAPRKVLLHGDWSGAEGVFVMADRQRLHLVLLNLLTNAVQYNHTGGTVTLSSAPTAEGRLSIKVSDTGIGIAPENMDRLWAPFDRLGAERRDNKGAGLSLPLTRRLVEAMGGTITVQSTLGEGSIFRVELLLAPLPSI